MRALLVALLLAVALAIVACEEDFKACYEGDYVACSCGGTTVGYARCNAREAYAACVCDGTTPGVDAGRDASIDAVADAGSCAPEASDAGDAGDAARKKFLEDCTTNEECETCRCELFQARGRCTTACTTIADCASPSDACTNRGVCRPPL